MSIWQRVGGEGWLMPSRSKMPSKHTIAVDRTAEAYLALLHDRGIDDFFGNEETAFGPIVELLAKSAS